MKITVIHLLIYATLRLTSTFAQDAPECKSDDAEDVFSSDYTAVNLENALFGATDEPKSWCTVPICDRTVELHNGTICFPWEAKLPATERMDVFVRASSLQVKIGLYIDAVLAVEDRDLAMVLKAKLYVAWRDCRLTWDPAQYENITRLEIPSYAQLFKPQLIIQESFDEMLDIGEVANMLLHSNGLIIAEISQIQLKILCQFRLHYYPFDTQTCNITIISPFYDLRYINVTQWDNSLPETPWIDNDMNSNMWVFKNLSYSHELLDGMKSKFVTSLTIKRLPLFHLFNLVLPCSLLVYLCCAIFVMPVGDGGDDTKINMSVTILLSVVVFMLILYDRLPETGAYVALLSVYFAGCIIICSLSCLLAVLTCLVHSFAEVEDVMPVPKVIHKLVFHYIGPTLLRYRFRFLRAMSANNDDEAHALHSVSEQQRKHSGNGGCSSEPETMELMNCPESPAAKHAEETHQLSCCPFFSIADLSEWKLLSEVCDRMLFVFFTILVTVFKIVFFCMT